ncbi:MAG: gliding motility-associated C-terminal domain-containing protein, partial [Bacteroidota bacterium]
EDIGVSADTLNGDTLANGSLPEGIDQATLSGLAAGIYSVEVTQPSNGCITRKQITIPNVPAEVEIISVNVTSATNCFGNGIIEITEVQKDGVSDNLADYTFSFYTENPANPDASPAFTTNTSTDPEFDSAIGGITYFIVGTHTVFGCTTSVFQTEVLENLEYPVLVLDDFNRQTNCDPENPNGRLTVLADGQPENGDYNFQWYAGMMVSASDSLSTDDYPGATTNSVSRLDSGFFTVEVVNNVTGCSTVETYEMVNDTPDEFALTTSVSSNTNCSNPNGKVAVSVLNPTFDEVNGQPVARNYEFFWYLNLADATPENAINSIFNFQGSFIENLSEGNYYVLALDGSDNFCNSVVERVEVLDEFIRPEFEIETNDVTVCSDPKDGFAEIAIDNLSAVDITWFDDMNNQIGTGFFVDSLDGGEISREYSVTVVNTITQCHKELVFEIYNNSETPGAPSVSVDNARNNCLLINGSAIANVGGVTDNFLFEWFELEDIDNPYAVGSQVNTLDSGTYFVTATNITTGCTSDSTLVNIGFEEIIPEFDISVENSICLRTEDGATNQFTGSAILQFAEFNLPDIIEWTFLETNEIVGRDTRLIDASPGEYQVRVVAENGCEYFRNFTINVTLNIYNGVSSNGDGRNDFFLIDCIDYFPSNNVKIFNRAGQRIYEVDGYDNSSIRFEGVSNVGGGGLVLPSGTYFYIVNLGTGEDPLQGYLELVR